MISLKDEQRKAVVSSARCWLGTPYHHRAHVIGHGVDCAQLLLRTFVDAGLINEFNAGFYTGDWHLHRNEERYLEIIERYCTWVDEFEEEQPLKKRVSYTSSQSGNIIMFRVGRTFSHSAIITEWPFMIHAYLPSRRVEEIDIRGTPMATRPMRIYSYWGEL